MHWYTATMESMNRRDFLKKLGAAAAVPAIDAIASHAEAAEDKTAIVRELFALLELPDRYTMGTTPIDAAEIANGIAIPGPRRLIFEARLAGVIGWRLKEIATDMQNLNGNERAALWSRVQKAWEKVTALQLPPSVMIVIEKDYEAIRKMAERDA